MTVKTQEKAVPTKFMKWVTLVLMPVLLQWVCGCAIRITSKSAGTASTDSSATTDGSCTSILVDNTQSQFSTFGLSSHLDWDTTDSWLELNSVGSNSMTSRIIDGCSSVSWTTLSWVSTLPTYKELPSNASSEETSSYSSLPNSTLMNSNYLVLHLNETSGSFLDSSGNSNSATTHGGVTYGASSNGKFGNAPVFDGTNGYLTVNHTAAMSSEQITVAAWVNPSTSTPNDFAGIFSHSGSGANLGYQLAVRSTGLIVSELNDGTHQVGAGSLGSTTALLAGNWYHVALVLDRTGTKTASIYVNGVAEANQIDISSLTGSLANAVSMNIGAERTASVFFPGRIDEVSAWNRVLTSQEIAALYYRGANRIKFQVRAWDSSDYPSCVLGSETGTLCPTFIGPDGTTATFFTELLNTGTLTPSVSLSSIAGRYFQYQATLESDTSMQYPQLKSVTLSH